MVANLPGFVEVLIDLWYKSLSRKNTLLLLENPPDRFIEFRASSQNIVISKSTWKKGCAFILVKCSGDCKEAAANNYQLL